MYIKILDGIAHEIIPDFQPEFPGIPVTERYTASFLSTCVYVPDDTPVKQGDEYIASTRSFRSPTGQDDITYRELIEKQTDETEQIRADVDFIAAMTGVVL